jgi:membrane protease YdiL (CAAX protease family)
VSFVVAGLREELWRAVVFAGLLRWRPRWNESVRGRLLMISLAAVIFGFGHLPQGWAGVGLTAMLGAGLGAILLFHRSLWMAVLAHGFFDAASFIFLRLLDSRGLLDQILHR